MPDSARYKDDPATGGGTIAMTKSDAEYVKKATQIVHSLMTSKSYREKFANVTGSTPDFATDECRSAGVIGLSSQVKIVGVMDAPNVFHFCIPTPRQEEPGEGRPDFLTKLAAHLLRSCADGC